VANNEDDGMWTELIFVEFEIPPCHFLEKPKTNHKKQEMNEIQELSERL
jgi:hypothetical protein